MIATDVVRALLALAVPALYAVGWLNVPALLVLTFGMATAGSLFGPARISRSGAGASERLLAANGLVQVSWQLGLLIGPAAGAALIPLTGVVPLFSIDAATFLSGVDAAANRNPVRAQRPRWESGAGWRLASAGRSRDCGMRGATGESSRCSGSRR